MSEEILEVKHEQEKEPKTTKQKIIFGFKLAGNVIFYSLIVLILLFSIGNIRAKNHNDRIPNVLGRGFLTVQSNSMEGNNKDSFDKGDLIIVDIANEKEIDNIVVGDVITFIDMEISGTVQGAGARLNTHRVVYVSYDANGKKEGFLTMGDKAILQYNTTNPDAQFDYKEDLKDLPLQEAMNLIESKFKASNGIASYSGCEAVLRQHIVGIYTGKVKGFGKTIDFINDNFIVTIVLPVGAFFIIEVALFIFHLIKMREEKLKLQLQVEASNSEPKETEEEMKARLKEELRKQLLAEMQAEADQTKEKEENKEESDSDSENE